MNGWMAPDEIGPALSEATKYGSGLIMEIMKNHCIA